LRIIVALGVLQNQLSKSFPSFLIMIKTYGMGKNNKKIVWFVCYVICCSLISFSFTNPGYEEPVPYPEGYRGWTHIKTAVVEPGNPAFDHFGGFHHIYANKQAMEGYKTGYFAAGSIIVFDVLEAIDTNKLLLEGKRRQIDVMVKDSIRYASTGGWGFEEFHGDSKTERTVTTTAVTACYSCHSNKKTLVFSQWRP